MTGKLRQGKPALNRRPREKKRRHPNKAPKLLENVGKKAEREKQQHLFESAEPMPMPPLELLMRPNSRVHGVIRRQNWSRCLGY